MTIDIKDLCLRRFGSLYELDGSGDLVETLSLPRRPAPLFHGMVFEGGVHCRFREDVVASVRVQIDPELTRLKDFRTLTPDEVSFLSQHP